MITTHTFNKETWVDVDNGTPDEIRTIMDTYGVHPFIAKELSTVTPKPRIETREGHVYFILHFPVFKHTHNKDEKQQEVDFIMSKNTLITARYGTVDALHKLAKDVEVKEILDKDNHTKTNRYLLTSMLRGLYLSVVEELANIEDLTEDITGHIFKGDEKDMVIAISEVTRTLLDFKKTLDLHHEILEALHHHGREMFGDTFAHDIEGVLLEYLKINTMIKSNLEMLRELRETNNSLLTSKQNEVIKKLTVMGFVILPLNLIAWIFAMRTEGMPFITNPNGFWIVLTIMAFSSVVTITIARHKRWI